MYYKLCTALLLLILIHHDQAISQVMPEVHGHRGCRGIMPENSLPGFLKAVELGVDYIEMDVVISADREIVISHEPWMSAQICRKPDGSPLVKSKEKSLILFRMNYAEIQQYDCGSGFNSAFPDQQKIRTVKPSLKMAIRLIKQFASENKYATPRFNIELKSAKSYYNTYIPEPAEFVNLVVNEIRRLGIEEQTILQSFDINVLEALNEMADKKYRISYLVEKGKKAEKALSKLSFSPDIYSPLSTLLTTSQVQHLHQRNIKVVPWTVNDKQEIEKLTSWGVDGIITDFPERIQ